MDGGQQHHLRAINRVRAAGSIRDDGPLPDTHLDRAIAQSEYAHAIEGAGMILMLGTMLHAIGTGNMVADRGSIESTGIVTDVGLFLNLLAVRLCDAREEK